VVVFLFGFVVGGVNQNGVLAEGTITSANIIPRGSSAACMGGLATFENLLERIRNGSVYVNAHTVAFEGGEIRGQIK
jgi:CHRD domain